MPGDAVTDPQSRAGISPGDGVTKNVYVYVSKRNQTPWDEVQTRWQSHVSKP